MNIESFLFNDTAGKKSVTVTAFIWGALVVNAKLLIAGLTIGSFTMSAFTGVDYSAAMGALGAVYVLRRHVDNLKDAKAEEETDGK